VLLPELLEQVREQRLLAEVGRGAAVGERARQVAALVGRQQEHHRARPLLAQAARRLAAVDAREVDVGEDEVGLAVAGHLDRRFPAVRFADALETVGHVDHGLGRGPERFLVVDHQDAHHIVTLLHARHSRPPPGHLARVTPTEPPGGHPPVTPMRRSI
jgi:hypothetical protein